MTEKKENKLTGLMYSLWECIRFERRMQLFNLLLLMFFSSISEVIGLGAVVPFLAVLMNPANLYEKYQKSGLNDFLIISDANMLIPVITIGFILMVTVSTILRILLLRNATRVSFWMGSDLSCEVYKKALNQPYQYHLSINSSRLMGIVSIKTNAVIYTIIFPLLVLLSSLMTLIFITAFLILLDPIITVATFLFLGLFYYCLSVVSKKALLSDGTRISEETSNLLKLLQESFGGIRDVLIDGSQESYCTSYKRSDDLLRRSQGRYQFISQAPRFVIEYAGMIMIVIMAYYLSGKDNGLATSIPMLGLIALGAQRMLPVLQQIYVSRANILNGKESLKDVIEILSLKNTGENHLDKLSKIEFKDSISFRDIQFQYEGSNKKIFTNLNFTIDAGDKIGIVGKTGSGKSTLLDLLMGMIYPTGGNIVIDGVYLNSSNVKNWWKNIAHVPQFIYLIDGTIEENITLSYGEMIDQNRLEYAVRKAELADFIKSIDLGYKTRVGERGVRLSGGQRQRIGIARALYKNAGFLVFDEATSALDEITEERVMSSIADLRTDLTMIIATHKVETLKRCNKIIEVVDNGINLYSYTEWLHKTHNS